MSKLRVLAQKCAALLLLLHCLVATAVHLFREKVQQQCNSFSSMVRRISRTKIPIYRSSKCSSSNTFQNLSESNEYSHSYDLPDEFDHEDYDEWWEHREQDLEDCEEWWDGPVYNRRGKCWEEEAVDEAIEEERNSGTIGDIPF